MQKVLSYNLAVVEVPNEMLVRARFVGGSALAQPGLLFAVVPDEFLE